MLVVLVVLLRKEASVVQIRDVDIIPYEEVAEKCSVLFFCVPAHAYKSVVDRIKEHLDGKTIVHISNIEKKGDPCNALELQTLLPSTNDVKALNNLSAYY